MPEVAPVLDEYARLRSMPAEGIDRLNLLGEIRFDFDKWDIHDDATGAREERRAEATHDYLVSLGVPAYRLRTASYGKEAPLCSESTEDCWARNRRAKLKVTGTAR